MKAYVNSVRISFSKDEEDLLKRAIQAFMTIRADAALKEDNLPIVMTLLKIYNDISMNSVYTFLTEHELDNILCALSEVVAGHIFEGPDFYMLRFLRVSLYSIREHIHNDSY